MLIAFDYVWFQVNDIDIAKRMMIKDFDHFVDRTQFGLKFDEKIEAERIFLNMFM